MLVSETVIFGIVSEAVCGVGSEFIEGSSPCR